MLSEDGEIIAYTWNYGKRNKNSQKHRVWNGGCHECKKQEATKRVKLSMKKLRI